MSKRHYSAIFVLLAILIGCSTDVSTEPCIENARYITVDCQAKIAELRHQEAKQQQQLENQARRAELGNWLLAALVVVLCSGALVAIRAFNQRLNSNAGLQVWQEEKARQHQQAMAKIYGVNAASLAASSRPLPVQMPHTLTMNNTDSHAVTYTDGRRYTTSKGRLKAQEMQLTPEALAELEQPPRALPSIPEVFADPELIVGYDLQGQKVTAHPSIFNAADIGGGMGSGKSTLEAFIAAQLAIKFDYRFIVLDPHKNIGERGECFSDRIAALAPFFMCEPVGMWEMAQGIAYVQSVIDARLRPSENREHQPFTLLVDEFVALMQSEHAAELRQIGQTTSQQLRKVKGGGVYASHIFKKEVIGDMGYSIHTHATCRTSREMAKIQMGVPMSQVPADIEALTAGQFYWKPLGALEPKKLTIPHMTPAALEHVVQSSRKPSSSSAETPRRATRQHREAPRKPHGNRWEVPAEVLALPIPKAKTWTAEEQRVIDAMLEGMKPSQIVRKIFGIKGGRKYAPTRDWVNEVWRRYSS